MNALEVKANAARPLRMTPDALFPAPPAPDPAPLDEAAAIDIWIARWLKIRRKDILARYACDPRRLYEIWEGGRFPGAREKALTLFRARHPGLADRIDFGHHQRIARSLKGAGQLTLFEA